ncbi:hypothetical protein AKO1_005508 [Acrasis kona]|uniref:Uncharacterized protein n=1 Tax=Acrasis kona TaxID=1008807 RepID=A0AAW2YKL8_9EUKA
MSDQQDSTENLPSANQKPNVGSPNNTSTTSEDRVSTGSSSPASSVYNTPLSKRSLNSSIQSSSVKFTPQSATPRSGFTLPDQTPSVIKSEVRSLLKKLDSQTEDVKAAEDLHQLCLFASNRSNSLDTGILSALSIALKTKPDRVKETVARTLQLFAQDGGEPCIQLKRLNMCNSSVEILSKTDDPNVQAPVVGFIYWLLQNPACKKEFIDMGADSYLKELNNKTKDPLLTKFLNYSLSSMSVKSKSREEMMQELLNGPNKATEDSGVNNSIGIETPSPRHFYNLFKTPLTQSRSPTSSKKLDFSTPLRKSPEKLQ